MPEPTPLSCGGTEFMIDAVFGDTNMPAPIPKIRRMTANSVKAKLNGSNDSPIRAAEEIAMPTVANSFAPCLSENLPPIGPITTKPMSMGTRKIPDQNGVVE